ncbi:cytochrome b [Marilutibacter alkalisoli]|uniref:Cytochrome b n=1 Tax=Marilutibacter alkalisoli TaxID=2591633 RepID=A0A514BQL3_9GAMM|nr:cytochrome b [Lysobacter alkalisoli]QDH69309.1 cytochrome b [Lysobacter alkalisoli]
MTLRITSLKNSVDRWGPVSQSLHWLIMLLILGMAVVGLSLDSLPKSPKYFWVYDLHKSTGLAVLALVVIRLAWRLYAGTPAPVAGTPVWQARIAAITHWMLYALILAMPLSGWLYDSASGLRPLKWFGLFTVPKLAAPDPAVRDFARAAHEWLFWVLVALVALHVAAAFYHHIFQNDDTLRRMLPRRGSSGSR